MPIEIQKIPSGYAVAFPIALKDAFRAAFPRATWNRDARRWEVGPRSKPRLETWVAEAQQAAAVLAARDEADLVAEDLERVRAEIARVDRECGTLDSQIERAREAHVLLASARVALLAAEARKAAAETARAEARSEVDALLARIIDIAAVKRAASTMASNMVPADSSRKARFELAREVCRTAHTQLHEAGFSLTALSKLALANVNRPDRDHPRSILDSDWYDLHRIDAQSD